MRRRTSLPADPSGAAPAYHQPVTQLLARVLAVPAALADAALAVALTLVEVGTMLPYHSQFHPFALAVALVAAQNLPLAWRRSHPVATFSVIGASRVTYDLVGLHMAPLPLGPAVAFFTVIDRCPPKRRWLLSALVVAGIVVSQLPKGHNEPYDATVAVLIFVTAFMAGALSRTHRSYLAEAETRAERAEADREAEAARAAAAERTQIAREMHDVVAHQVSLMAVQAEAALSLLPDAPEQAARSVEVIGATARQTLTELRQLLGVLRAPGSTAETVPSPSLDDIDEVLDKVRAAGLAVELRVTGTPVRLAPSVSLAAYRIVQEGLTNALRHAASAPVIVSLFYEPGWVTVCVSDDGAGRGGTASSPFLGASATGTGTGDGREAGGDRRAGFGLAGIAERVSSCGGRLSVGPTPAGGYAVSAALPAP